MDNSFLLRLGLDTKQLVDGVNKSNALLTGFSKSITSTLNSAFGGITLFQGLKAEISIIREFEKRMSEVKAITGASGDTFKELRDNALELGKTTSFAASEVAGLQTAYGRLGFTSDEILKVTKSTLQLAVATGEDLANSADIAGSTLRAFNLDASQMQKVIDVMAASFNKSALGLENFSEAMKYVAPVAAAGNVSLEETTALLGVLADNGIRGSMAGTSLRKIISDVKNETGSLAEKLEKLKDKGLTGADAMSEVGRTAYASLLVLTNHVDKVNEATIAYQNSTGEVKKMADTMADNLDGDVNKLSASITSLALSSSDATKSMRGMVQEMTSLVNLLNDSGIGQLFTAASEGFKGWLSQATVGFRIIAAIRKEWSAKSKEAIEDEKFTKDAIQKVWGDPIKVPDWIKNNSFGKLFADNMLYVTGKFKMFGDVVKEAVVTVDSLNKKKKDLNDLFDSTDVNDKKELKNIGDQIIAIEAQIAALEKLKKAKEGKNLDWKDAFIRKPDTSGYLKEMTDKAGAASELGGFEKNGLINMSAVDNYLTQQRRILEQSLKTTKEVKAAYLDMSGAITGALLTVVDGMIAATKGTGNFGQTIIKALAAFARQIGEQLVAIGVGMLAAKQAIKNPYTAIAAGVTLIALSGAMSSAMSKAQGDFNSGGNSPSSVVQASGYNGGQNTRSKAYFEGSVSGYSLRLTESKEDYRRKRVG